MVSHSRYWVRSETSFMEDPLYWSKSLFPTAQSSPTFGAKSALTKGNFYSRCFICQNIFTKALSSSDHGLSSGHFFSTHRNWSIMRRNTPHHWASKGNKHWWIGAHADSSHRNILLCHYYSLCEWSHKKTNCAIALIPLIIELVNDSV